MLLTNKSLFHFEKNTNNVVQLYFVVTMTPQKVPPPPPPLRPPNNDDTMKIAILVITVISIFVIATVLVAAFMYMSLPTGSTIDPVDGRLNYEEEQSNPGVGNASFTIVLNDPSSIEKESMELTILNTEGEEVTSQIETEWISQAGTTEYVRSGDILRISSTKDIQGYNVRMNIDGYAGSIYGNVPSS